MKLSMDASQIVAIDVSVDLRGRDIGVTKHLLNGAKVGAALQQMSGEGMPQRVGRYRLLDPGNFNVLPKNLPCSHSRQRLAASVEKEDSLPLPRSSRGLSSRT